MRRILGIVATVLVVGFVAVQVVPYGREHTNPPITGEPEWSDARTAQLFMQACGDCHSNETAWPWYTNIAPISWRIQQHIDEGRQALNVSEWGAHEQEADDAAELVLAGEMPPFDYLLVHPEARLSGVDQLALADGLVATFGGATGEGGGDASGGGDENDESEGDDD